MKTLIITLLTVGIVLFFIPWMCMIAWNNWAYEFNLPLFNYWHWFVTVLALRGVFGYHKVSTDEGS